MEARKAHLQRMLKDLNDLEQQSIEIFGQAIRDYIELNQLLSESEALAEAEAIQADDDDQKRMVIQGRIDKLGEEIQNHTTDEEIQMFVRNVESLNNACYDDYWLDESYKELIASLEEYDKKYSPEVLEVKLAEVEQEEEDTITAIVEIQESIGRKRVQLADNKGSEQLAEAKAMLAMKKKQLDMMKVKTDAKNDRMAILQNRKERLLKEVEDSEKKLRALGINPKPRKPEPEQFFSQPQKEASDKTYKENSTQ